MECCYYSRLRCFQLIHETKTQTWLGWLPFPMTIYPHGIFSWCCDYYIKFPLKRKWLWVLPFEFIILKSQRGEYTGKYPNLFCFYPLSCQSFLLSTHPSNIRMILLYMYIILLDCCLDWLFLKPKIRKKNYYQRLSNHSSVWITLSVVWKEEIQVKMFDQILFGQDV